MSASFDAVAFVARHGVVLASANGPVPSLAAAIAGGPIRGSWWGHARGGEIYRALGTVADSNEIVCLRLVEGKITFVHRRLWPALVRVSHRFERERLAAIRQEHMPTGEHRNVETSFPEWVPDAVRSAAEALNEAEAIAQLGAWATARAVPSRRTRRRR